MIKERDKEMKDLDVKGYSFAEIGRKYNLSKQRTHQIITGYRSFSGNNFSSSFSDSLGLGYICKLCFARRELIHHIDRNSSNNNLSNLLPLCKKCHVIVHKYIRIVSRKMIQFVLLTTMTTLYIISL